MLLSFKDLYAVKNKNSFMVDACYNLAMYNIPYYTYNNSLYMIHNLNLCIKNLEKHLTEELKLVLKSVPFKYQDKHLRGCFFYNCCRNYRLYVEIDKINNIKKVTDMYQHPISYHHCNINELVKTRYEYYAKYTMLKHLFMSVDKFLKDEPDNSDFSYIVRG